MDLILIYLLESSKAIGLCPMGKFRESDVSPGQTEVKQGNFVELISRANGYFRETYKSPHPLGSCGEGDLPAKYLLPSC